MPVVYGKSILGLLDVGPPCCYFWDARYRCLCYISILLCITNIIFHFFSYFFIIVSSFNYLLLLCIGLYSPFQLCKIKILYCKWIERRYKYIFYVKSSNCTILNVSAVIYVIMFMYNLEINYLSIYLYNIISVR